MNQEKTVTEKTGAPADDETADTVLPTANTDVPEGVGEQTQQVKRKLEEGYQEVERRYDETRMQLRDLNDRAVRFIQENPGWCIVGALGVGYVVGRLASRRWLR